MGDNAGGIYERSQVTKSGRFRKTRVLDLLKQSAKLIPAIVGFVIPLVFHFDGLSTSGHLCLSIFLSAACLWLFEPVPLFATAVLILLLEIVLLSKEGLVFRLLAENGTVGTDPAAAYKGYTAYLNALSNPLIVLFLGGFALADASRKFKVDQELARLALRPFGTNPKFILMGIMLITATFSAFMSNTACTAMMMAVIFPAMAALDPEDRFRAALALAVPFAANIGGMATPIGTPPNAVAIGQLAALNPAFKIEFLEWVELAAPFTLVMLGVVWVVLVKLFPTRATEMKMAFPESGKPSARKRLVYFTFGFTVLLWVTGQWHGIPDAVVALVPVAVFTLTGVLTPKEFNSMSWDILWLIAGGIALGTGMQATGLTEWMVGLVQWSSLPTWLVISAFSLATVLLSTFISNTAAANLFVPISLGVATSLIAADSDPRLIFEVALPLVASVGLAASLAMALPISTPPNAIAYATGQVKQKDMAISGAIIGLVGIVLLSTAVPWFWKLLGIS